MNIEHIGNKENLLLQRGIFSSSDFAAFLNSEVIAYWIFSSSGNTTFKKLHEGLHRICHRKSNFVFRLNMEGNVPQHLNGLLQPLALRWWAKGKVVHTSKP